MRVNKSGNLTLAGNNTYSGGTTITGGTVRTNSATALGQGSVIISGGALNANSQALENAITLQRGAVQNFGNAAAPKDLTVSLTGNATITDSTVVLNNAANTPMISTGQVLTMTGATTATLNNASLNLTSFNTALVDLQGTSSLTLTGGLTLNLGSDLVFDSLSQTIDLFTLGTGTSFTEPADWDSLLTLTQDGHRLVWDGVTFNDGQPDLHRDLPCRNPVQPRWAFWGWRPLLMRRKLPRLTFTLFYSRGIPRTPGNASSCRSSPHQKTHPLSSRPLRGPTPCTQEINASGREHKHAMPRSRTEKRRKIKTPPAIFQDTGRRCFHPLR